MRHALSLAGLKTFGSRSNKYFNLFGLILVTLAFSNNLCLAIVDGTFDVPSTKNQPPPPDPIQAKIFMMLPIIFTFLLATFPSGMVIYWTVNNILSIAQQYFLLKKKRKNE